FEHGQATCGTVIPQAISLAFVGNLFSMVIQQTEDHRGICSLNHTRFLQETNGTGSLIRFQVDFEEKLFAKEHCPERQRYTSLPRESDGGCMVERTTWSVSDSSDRAGGSRQDPSSAATPT